MCDPDRKYIQVCVQNVSDVSFTLAEVKLMEKQHAALELQSLNTKAQQVSRKKNINWRRQCKCSSTRESSLVFITNLTSYYISERIRFP